MRRGDLYRVHKLRGDPKHSRFVVVVSRRTLIESRFSSVICAPIYSHGEGLATQVPVGVDEGVKHTSWIMCDALASVPKSELTEFVASLSSTKLALLNRALASALDLR
jgi:mRNA interferase MazF